MKRKWILTVTILAMLAYQAWRVYDYMKGNLKGVDEKTAFWVALAFLAFSEIGLLVWLHIAQPGATTHKQEDVSNVMVWVDYGGSMLLGLADLVKHNTLYVIDLSRIDPILFIAPWVMVAANVAAWIVFETNDSEEMLAREERRLQHAEHELEIQARRAAIEEVKANSAGLSRKMAPYYYKDISDRVTGRTAARFGGGDVPNLPALPERVQQTRPNILVSLIGAIGDRLPWRKAQPVLILSNGHDDGNEPPASNPEPPKPDPTLPAQ